MAGRSFHSAQGGAALVLWAVILTACQTGTPLPPPLVQITVGDAPHQVTPGTTLGEIVERFGLEPRDGRLLSVSGAVLDPAIARGRIELNGACGAGRHTPRIRGLHPGEGWRRPRREDPQDGRTSARPASRQPRTHAPAFPDPPDHGRRCGLRRRGVDT